eukprot:6458956-Amphidinium_carterae.1
MRHDMFISVSRQTSALRCSWRQILLRYIQLPRRRSNVKDVAQSKLVCEGYLLLVHLANRFQLFPCGSTLDICKERNIQIPRQVHAQSNKRTRQAVALVAQSATRAIA